MSRPSERRLLRLLQRAELREADGLAVRVTDVTVRRRDGMDQVRIRYEVPPLPDGDAWQPWPRDDETLEAYAAAVAEELHGWATEHVRRHRPLPPPDLDEIGRSLPSRDELWHELRSGFSEVEDDGAGFQGVLYGKLVEVTFGADDWHTYVVWCEVGARRDSGVDAARAGDGPFLAQESVDELVASGWDHRVVLHLRDGRLSRGRPGRPA